MVLFGSEARTRAKKKYCAKTNPLRDYYHGMIRRTPILTREEELRALHQYKKEGNQESRGLLILSNLGLPFFHADRQYYKMPRKVFWEDLFHAGVVGLTGAIDAYDLRRGTRISTFAGRRVLGEILDWLRTEDWAMRTGRDARTKAQRTRDELRKELQREPSEEEILKILGIDSRRFNLLMNASRNVEFFGEFEHFNGDLEEPGDKCPTDIVVSKDSSPEENLEYKEILRVIKEGLSLRDHKIFELYYIQGKTMREVAGLLEPPITESGVCRIINYRIKGELEEIIGLFVQEPKLRE